LTAGSIIVNPTSSIPGLQVALSSSTTGICTVGSYVSGTGYTVNLLAGGNCSLKATQPGTSGSSSPAIAPAPAAYQTFAVSLP
jgi:hypothetical protein